MTNPPDRELEIFSFVRRLPDEERADYLERACAGNDALRRRIEELLKATDEAGNFLEKPAAVPPTGTGPAIVAEKPGDKIGRYKLLQQIGEGGCGVVYMAEQAEPVRRQVALKVIKLGMDTRSVIARFEAERQALALMDHPNIARVLDAGATGTGRPYFVMELVRGIKITDFCDKNQLPTRERLQLFIQVCQAIQHAHQKGIIHRDIKPSNILVTLNDGVPLPKVIDFGIAKATQQRLTDKTLFTAFEQFIGTPAYMSPEQAEMSAQGVDTRSDIYSLGVLLYELLTGKTPFAQQDLLRAGVDEIRRIIRDAEPVKPSTRLSAMLQDELTMTASRRRIEPPRLIHTVRGDLDWIVMKALEKERNRRYETANGFARDVERHLANEPVAARPPSRLYEFRKTVRRHWVGFTATAVVIAAMAAGLAVSAVMFFKEQQARKEAEAERKTAETEAVKSREVAQFLKDMLNGVGPSAALGRDTTMLREVLDKTAQRVGTDLTNQPLVEAEMQTTIGDVYDALGAYPEAEEMQRRALELRRMFSGGENLSVADSLHGLARTLEREGKDDEAESSLREAIALRAKLKRGEDLETAKCLNTLANVLQSLDRREEAEMAARQALKIQRKLLGNENLEVARSLGELCYILYYSGPRSEAETMGRQELAICRKLSGNNHPGLARACKDLSTALYGEGCTALEMGYSTMATNKLSEAEVLEREALGIYTKTVGDNHPETAKIWGNLAMTLCEEGKVDESVADYRKCIAICRNLAALNPPREIPIFGWALGNFGFTLMELTNSSEAMALESEALALYQRHPDWNFNEQRWVGEYLAETKGQLDGPAGAEASLRQQLQLARQSGNGRRICEMLFNLGAYLQKNQRFAEAEGFLQEMFQLRRTFVSGDVPYRRFDVQALSEVYCSEGKFEDAEALLRRALAISQKYYSEEPNQNIAWVEIRLASVLYQRKKLAEARSLAENATRLEDSHPDWSFDGQYWSLKLLGEILMDSGDLAGAEKVFRRRLANQRAIEPNDSITVGAALSSLGAVLARENKFADAEIVYRERLAVLRNSSDTNPEPVASTIKALANVLKKQGKTNEAQALLHPPTAAQH